MEKETFRPTLAIYMEKNEKINNGKALLSKTELGRLFNLDRHKIAKKFDFRGKKEISLSEAIRQLVLM